jgi:hypothetical protein
LYHFPVERFHAVVRDSAFDVGESDETRAANDMISHIVHLVGENSEQGEDLSVSEFER